MCVCVCVKRGYSIDRVDINNTSATAAASSTREKFLLLNNLVAAKQKKKFLINLHMICVFFKLMSNFLFQMKIHFLFCQFFFIFKKLKLNNETQVLNFFEKFSKK